MKTFMSLLLIIFLVSCSDSKSPNSKFAQLDEQLENLKTTNKNSLNLEATIKVIFTLDEAIKNVKDVQEYTEYLYKQDMTGVAPDVISSYQKLLPVLDNLYDAEAEKEVSESVWTAFSEFGSVATVAVKSGVQITSGDLIGGGLNLAKAGADAISIAGDRYEREIEVLKKIKKVKETYLEYVKFSSPIFLKYMTQWDKLCAQRDQAYISLYNSNYKKVVEFADTALELSPNDRESILLKCFALLSLNNNNTISNDEQKIIQFKEIETILASYFEKFPSSTAPAFVLKGILEYQKGEIENAFTLFDEASILYPKQSEALLDLMNIFKIRGSIFRSVESEFIVKTYMSTMEGFGNFSPNFQKAILHRNLGNKPEAIEEIKRHFFRRGNQVVQDYLPGDLNFCNKYLPTVFSEMFVERPFVDIEVSKGSIIDPKNSLRVKMINNSSRTIENVRLFLCIHFTESYKDNYQVFKVPNALNILPPYAEKDYDEPVEVNYEWLGSKKIVPEDIVKLRGVIITDDIVSWIDEKSFKFQIAKDRSEKYGKLKTDLPKELVSALEASDISVDEGYVYNDITFSIPKELIALEPFATINDINSINPIQPKSKQIDAQLLVYKFRTMVSMDNLKEIHIVTNSGGIKIPIPKSK
jgi:tetratricopeptide (TPR) repeat protein